LEERAGFLAGLAQGDSQAWAAGDMAQYYPGLRLRYRNQWYLLDSRPRPRRSILRALGLRCARSPK
ncbi:MAG TPA: hypothetical protein VGT43_10405, partial [Burkholderiales bacterium]|nr:hypothetical protein [Burkholderiales bacterium]